MCSVYGKQSYGVARFTVYPCFVRYFKSLASVSGPHDTYTTLSGDSLTTDDKNASSLPVRGGSIMTTSAFLDKEWIARDTKIVELIKEMC